MGGQLPSGSMQKNPLYKPSAITIMLWLLTSDSTNAQSNAFLLNETSAVHSIKFYIAQLENINKQDKQFCTASTNFSCCGLRQQSLDILSGRSRKNIIENMKQMF